MTIKACGPRLVIKADESPDEEVSDGGIIIAGDSKIRRAAVEKGVVQSIGSTCWKAFTPYEEDFVPWCSVGDYITYARYAGRSIEDTTTQETYVVINDEDVVSIIETKEERDGRAND